MFLRPPDPKKPNPAPFALLALGAFPWQPLTQPRAIAAITKSCCLGLFFHIFCFCRWKGKEG